MLVIWQGFSGNILIFDFNILKDSISDIIRFNMLLSYSKTFLNTFHFSIHIHTILTHDNDKFKNRHVGNSPLFSIKGMLTGIVITIFK